MSSNKTFGCLMIFRAIVYVVRHENCKKCNLLTFYKTKFTKNIFIKLPNYLEPAICITL